MGTSDGYSASSLRRGADGVDVVVKDGFLRVLAGRCGYFSKGERGRGFLECVVVVVVVAG